MARKLGVSPSAYRGLPAALWVIPIVLCAAAIAPFPYGFYALVKLGVCASVAFLAYRGFTAGDRSFWPWLFAGVAAIFNPILPVVLGREAWVLIDIATAGALLIHWLGRQRSGCST